MAEFKLYNVEDAPHGSKTAIVGLRDAFGFVPNVAAVMAASPVLINCLAAIFGNVHSGSFSERQLQVLLLTNAVTNAADWAVAFHSFLASQQGISTSDVDAIREGRLPSSPADAALSNYARLLIGNRGKVRQEDVEAFMSAGFTTEQSLEVVAVVAASTITNYTVSITRPPVEAPFDVFVWSGNSMAAAEKAAAHAQPS